MIVHPLNGLELSQMALILELIKEITNWLSIQYNRIQSLLDKIILNKIRAFALVWATFLFDFYIVVSFLFKAS